MLSVIEDMEEYSIMRKKLHDANYEKAIADYNADPSVAKQVIGHLYLERKDALYLLDILPGWIEFFGDMEGNSDGEDAAVARLWIDQLEDLLDELDEVEIYEASPRQEYLIAITPLNDVLGSIFEQQVEHELLELTDERKKPRKVIELAERVKTVAALGIRMERTMNLPDEYVYKLSCLYATDAKGTKKTV